MHRAERGWYAAQGRCPPSALQPPGRGPNLHSFKSTDWILTMSMICWGWRGTFLFFSNWQFKEGGVGSWYDRYRELSIWKWKSFSRVWLCDPMDYTVHRILQARILEWVACPFSSRSSQPRNWTGISCIAGKFFTNWAIREAKVSSDRELHPKHSLDSHVFCFTLKFFVIKIGF